jgi:cytochrome b
LVWLFNLARLAGQHDAGKLSPGTILAERGSPIMLDPHREIISSQSQIYVWNPFVRFFHWALVTAFVIAYLVIDPILVHVSAGTVVGVLIAARFIWGLIGPEHERFSDFLYPPTTVFYYVRDLLRLREHARYVGHSPGGGYVILAMLALLTATVVTGVIGPTNWHGTLADTTLAVIFVHVAGVLLRSFVYGQNLVRAQFTGYKRL